MNKTFLTQRINQRRTEYDKLLTSKDFDKMDALLKADLILAVVQNTNVDIATERIYIV